ncbi:S-adenosylmethionine synthetase [Dirofilaria immitis]|nr:S-adenosylmethionine synthetase [Dirofilaria immitis]
MTDSNYCVIKNNLTDSHRNRTLTHVDLSTKGIIKHLSLNRPIYKYTAYYGHFGKKSGDGFGNIGATNVARTGNKNEKDIQEIPAKILQYTQMSPGSGVGSVTIKRCNGMMMLWCGGVV